MRAVSLTIAAILVTGTASIAAAHCCHDERMLGIAEQSDDLRHGELRRGTQRSGRLDNDEDGVFIGDGLNQGHGSLDNGGGLGQMRGNNVGNYGGGSLGERGPGGLGALRGDSILQGHPRPR
jgi:hypothetical protein